MGNVDFPMKRRRFRGFQGADQGPVGDDRQRLGNGHDRLGGRAIVGKVIARNPVTGFVRLALRPDRLRMFVGRAHEIHSALRRTGITDDERQGIARVVRLVERDLQGFLVFIVIESKRLAVLFADRDAFDLQLGPAVERHRVDLRKKRRENVRHFPFKLFLLGIESQFELNMFDVVRSNAFFMFRCARLGERLSSRRSVQVSSRSPLLRIGGVGCDQEQEQTRGDDPTVRSLHGASRESVVSEAGGVFVREDFQVLIQTDGMR